MKIELEAPTDGGEAREIGGSDDQKRRLLYNAVTRAKERCLVLVQAQASLGQATNR